MRSWRGVGTRSQLANMMAAVLVLGVVLVATAPLADLPDLSAHPLAAYRWLIGSGDGPISVSPFPPWRSRG
jgi:hypothetical protein